MSTLLFEKEVDQSLLKSGLTIPVNMQDKIQDAVGVRLGRGQKTDIKINLDGQLYNAVLTNVNFQEKYSNRTAFQIRYAEGSPICKKLKEFFSYVDLPSSNAENGSIEVYSNDDNTLIFKVKSEIKESFFNYLGPSDSLVGYQRSYKLVFYKVFFERIRSRQETSCQTITSNFQQYYVERKSAGLKPDNDADSVIENIENSSLAQVYSLILRNPYNAISKRGYIVIENNDIEQFVLNPVLNNQLSSDDIENIISIVDKKLKLYFSNIDTAGKNGIIRDIVEKILNDYIPAKGESFTGHPLGTYFRSDIPREIYATGIVNSNKYLITGSVGQGNWAMIPWVCIFDRNITTTATKGVYIVYLLKKDGTSLYLTFNQGCTEIRNSHTKRETIRIMRAKAIDIISRIDSRGFRTDEDINLGEGLTELGELYQKGTIFYKEYKKSAVPDEEELQDDLSRMMEIYREYANKDIAPKEHLEIDDTQPEGNRGEEELTVKETIERIKRYIESKGFSYQDGLIENFYLSLKSKPFVILAGTSGTGKTRLVKLFAEAIGAKTENGRYKMVSVRPDWSDSTDLFGHVDLNGEFIPGSIIDFMKRAELDSRHPYFLCLDEMNLARVEYYLSDFLSVIETRDFQTGHIISDPLVTDAYYGPDRIAAGKYGTILFPENLYVVGTVNMDETTFPFSRKVLDRANTIEFSYVDLTPPTEWPSTIPDALSLNNDFLKTEYLLLVQCEGQQETVNEYCAELQNLNHILQRANAHVGYRVRDEIIFYMLNNKTSNLLPENEAMDNEIIQKILPRLQGSSASIKNMLCELFKVCAGEYEGQNTESDLSSKMMKVAQQSDCKYKKSAQKIAFMVRRFEEDGFTSYWL